MSKKPAITSLPKLKRTTKKWNTLRHQVISIRMSFVRQLPVGDPNLRPLNFNVALDLFMSLISIVSCNCCLISSISVCVLFLCLNVIHLPTSHNGSRMGAVQIVFILTYGSSPFPSSNSKRLLFLLYNFGPVDSDCSLAQDRRNAGRCA
jgi:hypothetical protein